MTTQTLTRDTAESGLSLAAAAIRAVALAQLAHEVITSDGDPHPELTAFVLAAASPLRGAELDAAWEMYLMAVRLEFAIEEGRAVWHVAAEGWRAADPLTGADRSREWSAQALAVLTGRDGGQSL